MRHACAKTKELNTSAKSSKDRCAVMMNCLGQLHNGSHHRSGRVTEEIAMWLTWSKTRQIFGQ